MLRGNQRGSIDYFLYGLAVISVLIFLFFLVITLANPPEQEKTNNEITRSETTSRANGDDPPADWHRYTNNDNDFSFSYPKEWGVVEKEEFDGKRLESTSYEYRFTSNEKTVVSQVNGRSDETDHQEDYLNYNSFDVMEMNVQFCNTEACEKSKSVPTKDVRLFTTESLREGAELVVVDGLNLRLIQVVNTDFDDWPGVVVSTLLDDSIDEDLAKEEVLDKAITNSYVETEFVRQFAEFIE